MDQTFAKEHKFGIFERENPKLPRKNRRKAIGRLRKLEKGEKIDLTLQ